MIMTSLLALSCSRAPRPTATYDRDHDGRVDTWVYNLSKSQIKVALDTNHDGRPDVVETFRDDQLVKVEEDRNHDGRVDLIKTYDQGRLVRAVNDDDFDGKPERITTYRNGRVALIERDPDETGSVMIAEYYNDKGLLVRRETRKGSIPIKPFQGVNWRALFFEQLRCRNPHLSSLERFRP